MCVYVSVSVCPHKKTEKNYLLGDWYNFVEIYTTVCVYVSVSLCPRKKNWKKLLTIGDWYNFVEIYTTVNHRSD